MFNQLHYSNNIIKSLNDYEQKRREEEMEYKKRQKKYEEKRREQELEYKHRQTIYEQKRRNEEIEYKKRQNEYEQKRQEEYKKQAKKLKKLYQNRNRNQNEDNQEENAIKLLKEIKKIYRNKKYALKYKEEGINKYISLNKNTFNTIKDKLTGVSIIEINKTGSDNLDNFHFKKVEDIEIVEMNNKKNNNDGAFFPYENITSFDLTKYQIYKNGEKNDNEHCLMFALRQSNKFTNEELQKICNLMICDNRSFPRSKLTLICETLECGINLTIYREKVLEVIKYGKQFTNSVDIGLYESHYFINDICPIHLYAVKNREKYIDNPNLNKIYRLNGNLSPRYSTNFKNKAIHIIKEINKTNGFVKLKFDENYGNIDYQCLDEKYKSFELLNSDINFIPVNLSEKNWKEDFTGGVYFADFETNTDTEYHEAYMASLSGMLKDGEMNYLEEYCCSDLLNKVEDKSLVIFHNMKYDYQQLFPKCNIDKICEKDGVIYQVELRFYGKRITIRDSYKMIPLALKDFSKTFGLKSKKEIMPYGLYNSETTTKYNIPLSVVEDYYGEQEVEDENGNKLKTYDQFVKLASSIGCIGKNKFYHMKYATYYCNQDVKVLKEGFLKFREWCLEHLDMDILNYLTISSLADQYFIKKGCYEGVTELSGSILTFVQESVVGGRVMSKDNKKWHLKEKIQDFDGVSLYPSAMSRIEGFPIGTPKIFKRGQKIKDKDYYVVEIKLLSINETMDCPVFSNKNKEGTRVWDHSIPENNMIVDKITLEDMIKYHGAKYKVVRGIYWDNGFNNKINEEIKNMFNLRLKYKKEKNEVENVFKLLMNSAYGKTIMKPTSEKIIIKVGKEEFDKYLSKNFNMIKSWVEYPKENSEWNNYKIRVYHPINENKNRAHCGSMILSMSKRIMNEVVYAAKLSDCPIYYSDTDSTHIPDSKVKDLENKYKELYGRELIGNQLGQFHCDFKLKVREGVYASDVVAVETVIVDKKTYCDKLIGNYDGKIVEGYHFRCKGISAKSIMHEAKNKFNNNIIDLYNSNKKINFDLLCDGQIKFEYVDGKGVRSNKEFKREVQF